jgi:hypothetical protein
MSFFLAPALVKLRDEVNVRFPNRDKASDGWIGDASHQAAKSDHNPCWSCSGRYNGIVRAIDIDISPDGRPNVDLRKQLLKVTVGDPRVWYVISNGVIYSRTSGFAPRAYTGVNGHFAHVHVSLNGANGLDPSGNFDMSPWFPLAQPEEPPKLSEAPRIENFRDSRPNYDVKILDRAIKHGRKDLEPKVERIERIVRRLPDEEKGLVKQFKDGFKDNRVLQLPLLNEAVSKGRIGEIKDARNDLRKVIKSIVFV